MSYTSYDFSESIARVTEFSHADVAECIAAWGWSGEYAEWHGGFLLRLKDGRHVYLTGWCDTTGWGCQGGIDITIQGEPFDRSKLEDAGEEWDEAPADLNRYIRGEITEFIDDDGV